MKSADVAAWVSAAAAVLAIAGSAFAWWRANLAKRARDAAEQDATRAERAMQAAEGTTARLAELTKQIEQQVRLAEEAAKVARSHAQAATRSADGLETIAEAIAPQRLTWEWESEEAFRLLNNTDVSIKIEHVRNREQFTLLSLETPFTIQPRFSIGPFTVLTGFGYPLPRELVLDEVGADAPLPVRIPFK